LIDSKSSSFFCAGTGLDLFLAGDGVEYVSELLDVDQLVDFVARGETAGRAAVSMLGDAPC
jgi:hypothetical protein